nr:MAG TPA: hypothetical protein [Caudoviricetes sp.]
MTYQVIMSKLTIHYVSVYKNVKLMRFTTSSQKSVELLYRHNSGAKIQHFFILVKCF